MSKYLEYFPKPLLDDLVAGRWLPVVGAGMSMNAKLGPGKRMPLWPELGEILSKDLAGFTPTGTLDAVSAFQHEFGRSKLIERLIDILHIKDGQPGIAHKSFCEIPFDMVCTTNFDFLLERQYDKGSNHVYVVVDEDQLSINGSPSGVVLLKIHGDLRHPSRLVVSEEDYDAFLNKYPLLATYVANLLITRTAVFVGYSLDDPDFRQIWQIVTSRLGKTRRMAYAIMVSAGPSEIARYERRGVKIINLPGLKSNYTDILSEAFAELHSHWRDNVISASKVTEEEPLRELLLPRDVQTRLCYFSIPLDRISLYRSEVFPHVQALGLVPVIAEDVISPGDSINAKIDALIDRAAIMVVELQSLHTRNELKRALNRRDGVNGITGHKLPTVIIGAASRDLDEDIEGGDIYKIAISNLTDDPANFIEHLTAVLERIIGLSGIKQDDEPQRLLRRGESRAAVISAMTKLETRLRQGLSRSRLSSEVNARKYPAESLRVMLDEALNAEWITLRERKILDHWIKIRNEIVHSGTNITSKQAREIVNGANEILQKIPVGR
jgi:hypothetical protein